MLKLIIPKTKAEYPALAVAGLVVFAFFGIFYGRFGWIGGMTWLLIAFSALTILFMKRRGNYYVEVDTKGIRWRQNILSTFIDIPWEYVQRIDYLVYEINFKIKESGQVVSFGLSNIKEEEIEVLKQSISNRIEERTNHGS